jgi:cell division protein FtsW
VQTDYVYSAIGEELGFLGTTAVLMLLALLVLRGVRIALLAESDYARLVAVGLAATLGVQAVIIVAGVVRMLPLTGITLPFVSYGGSSLLTNFLLVGLLINLSGLGRTRR